MWNCLLQLCSISSLVTLALCWSTTDVRCERPATSLMRILLRLAPTVLSHLQKMLNMLRYHRTLLPASLSRPRYVPDHYYIRRPQDRSSPVNILLFPPVKAISRSPKCHSISIAMLSPTGYFGRPHRIVGVVRFEEAKCLRMMNDQNLSFAHLRPNPRSSPNLVRSPLPAPGGDLPCYQPHLVFDLSQGHQAFIFPCRYHSPSGNMMNWVLDPFQIRSNLTPPPPRRELRHRHHLLLQLPACYIIPYRPLRFPALASTCCSQIKVRRIMRRVHQARRLRIQVSGVQARRA